MKKNRYNVYFLFFVALFCATGIYIVYSVPLSQPPIRSDGYGYYLYLPATFIYKDISLQTIANLYFDGSMPVYTGANQYFPETNSFAIKYPVGEAVLLSPFFFLGWLAALTVGAPQDGFSNPFQYAAAISGVFYGVSGMVLLWRFLARKFTSGTILLSLFAVLFGTNLFHFMTYDNIFSHVYSFFLFSAFLYLVAEYLYTEDSPRWSWCLLGMTAAMIVITRPTNIVWILIGILYGIGADTTIKQRIAFWRRNFWRGCVIVLSAFAIISIQMAYWRATTGSFVVYSYGNEGFDFLNPQISNVLFSIRRGVFVWTPLWLAVIPGLLFIRKKLPELFVPFAIFLPLNLYIISCWGAWWYGGSFGHRTFVESLPILAISLCAIYEHLKSPYSKALFLFGAGSSIAYTSWLMGNYWIGLLPFDNVALPHMLRAIQQTGYLFVIIGCLLLLLFYWTQQTCVNRRSVMMTCGVIALMLFASLMPLKRIDTVYAGQPLPEWRLWFVKNKTDMVFGETVQLRGYDITTPPRTGRFVVTLYWQSLQFTSIDYSGSIQVLDESNLRVQQRDQILANEVGYPTSMWQQGQLIADTYTVPIPEGGRPAEYLLRLTVYDWRTGEPSLYPCQMIPQLHL